MAIKDGTDGPDELVGTIFVDTLYGNGGDDVLDGLLSNDTLFGGDGTDILYGRDGNDRLDGGSGPDILNGGPGDDVYYWVDADDYVVEAANEGHDRIIVNGFSVTYTLPENGNVEDLTVLAGSGYGNSGANDMIGYLGAQLIDGGGGNDTISGGGSGGDDTLYGGDGDDAISFGTYYYGGNGNDTLSGTENADDLYGDNDPWSGADPGTGADLINGNNGNDTIDGGAGDDTLNGGAGNDTIHGDLDVFDNPAITGADSITGGDGNDEIYGFGGNDTIQGGDGDDWVEGMEGDDILLADVGIDTLTGGNGNDTYWGVTPDDVLVEYASGGRDRIVAFQPFTLPEHFEDLTTESYRGYGNAAANEILGFEDAQLLDGKGGNDTINGGGGLDTLYGGDGNDQITGGGEYHGGIGNDTLIGGEGADQLRGDAGANSMTGGNGNDSYFVDNSSDRTVEANADLATGGIDTVFSTVNRTLAANIENLRLQGAGNLNGNGNALNNSIFGNAGANILKGLAGNDAIEGRDGADTIEGGEGNDTLSGGGQADVFRFAATNTGVDRILDFSRNFDRFDLSGGTFTAITTAANGDAVLTHAGGFIRIATPPNLTLAEWNALVLPSGGRIANVAAADESGHHTFGDGLIADLRTEIATLSHGDWVFA